MSDSDKDKKKDNKKREAGARTKAATAGTVEQDNARIGGDMQFEKNPKFLDDRLEIWNELFQKQQEVYKNLPREEIKITMPDGAVKQGRSFETSPYDVAASISKQMADKIVVAKVKYSKRVATLDEGLLNPEAEEGTDEQDQWFYWDVNRKLEGDCELVLYKFDNDEGKQTFWHSSAHVLGQVLETEFGVKLTHGPPTDDGFFYDSYTGGDIFQTSHYQEIEKAAQKVVSSKQQFDRLVLSKEEALRLFGDNPFKVSLISNKIPDEGKVTAYRCGKLIDLCTGPHIPSTKIIKAFKVTKNSASYWLGKAENDNLQRIYGITFPSKKEMEEYNERMKEAAKRDHRTVGRQQNIFNMHELSPGCAFIYPKGGFIYNKLMDIIRTEYRVRGYQEVLSPNMYNLKLWKTSGHYLNYKDDLFLFKVENHGFGLKPMNCPGHCLMFAEQLRSFRELPIRFADFGVLHRNEVSGALTGLTRVRRFQQDDAHHFCTIDQIMDEIMLVLDFLDHIYGIFDFQFELALSTRPEKRLGDEALWDRAEGALKDALKKFGKPWRIEPGDGAFYGPKIDIQVFDALKRPHQCGTIQLDFQLPIRFNLQYKNNQLVPQKKEKEAEKDEDQADQAKGKKKGKGKDKDKDDDQKKKKEQKEEKPTETTKVMLDEKTGLHKQFFAKDEWDDDDYEWKEQELKPGFSRPVMIHRAVLGSVERFMAILIEHTAGKWPFFISPRQAIIVPLSAKFVDYCESVYLYLHKHGYQVELDLSDHNLKKKIAIHQTSQWNFILVAGEKEAFTGEVDVRTRENKRMGTMRVDKLHEYFQALLPKHSRAYNDYYAKQWDPECYQIGGHDHLEDEHFVNQDALNLHLDASSNQMGLMIQTVSEIAGAKLEIHTSSKEQAPTATGKFPYLETENQTIFDAEAIAQHIARLNPQAGLNGNTQFQKAMVNEWISWCQTKWLPVMHGPLLPVLGYAKDFDQQEYSRKLSEATKVAKDLDSHLHDRDWIIGDKISLADVYVGTCFIVCFQTLFDTNVRTGMPNLAKWFDRFIKHHAVVNNFGIIRPCIKAMTPNPSGN